MKLMSLLIFLCLLAVLWELGWKATGMHRLGPRELRRKLDAGWKPLLLDVRTPQEFRWFHIPGAVNAPFGSAELDTALELHARSDAVRPPVVVLCMTGHRSPLTAYALARTGLDEVYDLSGGMLGWKLFGGDVESGSTGDESR